MDATILPGPPVGDDCQASPCREMPPPLSPGLYGREGVVEGGVVRLGGHGEEGVGEMLVCLKVFFVEC